MEVEWVAVEDVVVAPAAAVNSFHHTDISYLKPPKMGASLCAKGWPDYASSFA